MGDHFMGWTQDQWEQACAEYNRSCRLFIKLPSMYRVAMCQDKDGMDKYLKVMEWWQVRRVSPPPNKPVVKTTESKTMSAQPDFGFASKIIKMGWEVDVMRDNRRYEIRVQIGNAHLVACEVLSEHNFRFGRDDGFKEHVERNCRERIKREIVDKLFPNL